MWVLLPEILNVRVAGAGRTTKGRAPSVVAEHNVRHNAGFVWDPALADEFQELALVISSGLLAEEQNLRSIVLFHDRSPLRAAHDVPPVAL